MDYYGLNYGHGIFITAYFTYRTGHHVTNGKIWECHTPHILRGVSEIHVRTLILLYRSRYA